MHATARSMMRVYQATSAAQELAVANHPELVQMVAQHTFISPLGIERVSVEGNMGDFALKPVIYHLDYLSRYHGFAEDPSSRPDGLASNMYDGDADGEQLPEHDDGANDDLGGDGDDGQDGGGPGNPIAF